MGSCSINGIKDDARKIMEENEKDTGNSINIEKRLSLIDEMQNILKGYTNGAFEAIRKPTEKKDFGYDPESKGVRSYKAAKVLSRVLEYSNDLGRNLGERIAKSKKVGVDIVEDIGETDPEAKTMMDEVLKDFPIKDDYVAKTSDTNEEITGLLDINATRARYLAHKTRQADFIAAMLLRETALILVDEVGVRVDETLSKSKKYVELKKKLVDFFKNHSEFRKVLSELGVEGRYSEDLKNDLLTVSSRYEHLSETHQQRVINEVSSLLKEGNVTKKQQVELQKELVGANLSALEPEVLKRIIEGGDIKTELEAIYKDFSAGEVQRFNKIGHAYANYKINNKLNKDYVNNAVVGVIGMYGAKSVKVKNADGNMINAVLGKNITGVGIDVTYDAYRVRMKDQISALDQIMTLKALELQQKNNGSLLISTLSDSVLNGLITQEKSKVNAIRGIYKGAGIMEYEKGTTKDQYDIDNEVKMVSAAEFSIMKSKDKTWEIVTTEGAKADGEVASAKYIIAMRKNPYGNRNTGIVEPVSTIENGLFIESVDSLDKLPLNVNPDRLKPNKMLIKGVLTTVNYRYILDENLEITKRGKNTDLANQIGYTKAHGIRVRGGLEVNNEIAKESMTSIESAEQLDKIIERLVDPKSDNPIFLKFGLAFNQEVRDGKHIGKITKLKEHYKDIDMKIKGDLSAATLVLKEADDLFLGSVEAFLGSSDSAFFRSTQKTYKFLVQNLKLNKAVKSPKVQAMNFASNQTILMLNNVPWEESMQYQKEAIPFMTEITVLQQEKVSADIKALAYPENEKYQKIAEDKQKEIEAHPFFLAIEEGFIQSIVDEIISDDIQSKHKFEKEFKRIASNLDNLPGSEQISDVMGRMLIAGGVTVKGLGRALGKVEFSKGMGDSFVTSGQKVVNQVMEDQSLSGRASSLYMNPGSEAGRVMTSAMQQTDAMARWALYRHLQNTGMDNKEAAKRARSSFIDYRPNLPGWIKNASDFGLVLYPTFMLRIQPVIWNILTEHPVKTISVALHTAMLNKVLSTELGDANILNSNPTNWFMNDPLQVVTDLAPGAHTEAMGLAGF